MPTNQKELVRLLSLEHGHKRASELSGVPYDLVRQWSVRGKWKSSHSVTKQTVDNVLSTLQEHERKTKLGLASYARRQAERAGKNGKLKDASNIHNVAKTAALVHRWDAKEQQSANVVVNVALLGIDPASVSTDTVLDVESEGQDSGD